MYFSYAQTIIFTSLFSYASALYSAKGSPCSSDCATTKSNFTGTGDLVCSDSDFTTASKGTTLKSCIQCLSTSNYVNSSLPSNGNSDQWWYLWYMKYVQQYCLIDTPQTTAASNCSSQCTPMKAVLDTSWIYNGAQPQYAYCSWNSSEYTQNAENCAQCLQAQEGGVVIGNFADTMNSACASQPLAANGGSVSSARDLFNSSTIATATTTSSSSSSTGSATTTSNGSTSTTTGAAANGAAASAPTSSSHTSSGLQPGAAAGIGVGVALGVLAVVGALAFFLIRRRKRAGGPPQELPSERHPESHGPPSYISQDKPPQNTQPPELEGHTHPSQAGLVEKYGHDVHEVEARNAGPRLQELDAS